MNSSTRLASSTRLGSCPRLALLFGLRLAAGTLTVFSAVACESDADPALASDLDAGSPRDIAADSTGELELVYPRMHSAFVEGHEARLPAMLLDPKLRSKGAKFTSSDPNIASVEATAEGAMITVRKDGVVAIKATLDGDFVNAKLIITRFSEAQWEVGKARYAKSELAIVPADGGAISAVRLIQPDGRNPNGACTTCHGPDANTLQIGLTPTQTAGYSDEELVTVFTLGKKPEGWPMRSQIPAFVWGMFHSWTVTEEEKQGLIAFLRTQIPRPQPPQVQVAPRPCIGADAATRPMLCDRDGKVIPIPGLGGALEAGAPAMSGDAGAAEPQDAGAPGDAG